MTRFFCSGDTRAKMAPCSAWYGQRGIVHRVHLIAGHDAVR